MPFKTARISLSDIDLLRDTFRITTASDNGPLIRSIETAGLLLPPAVRKEEERCTVVSGFRRLDACKALGRQEIDVRILEKDTPAPVCAEIAVTENIQQRALNPIETSRALHLLSRCIPDEKKMARKAADLGLPGHLSLIRKLKPLCRMPHEIQEAVLKDVISLNIACDLLGLESKAMKILVTLFEELNISRSVQNEILNTLKELAERDEADISSLMGAESLRKILDDDQSERNQKTRLIRQWLKKKRFPALTDREEAFTTLLSKLKLGEGVKLIPPRHFEGMTYTLRLDFKNLAELEYRKDAVIKMLSLPAMKEFLE